MAEEQVPSPVAAPAAPVAAPAEVIAIPIAAPLAPDRLTVPASAVFDDEHAEPISKTPAEKPADATAPAVKPAEVPAAKPGEPVKPADATAPAVKPAEVPAAKAEVPKIKLKDGKEYTVEELEKLISNPPAKVAPAPAAPAAAKPAEPAAPAAKPPTPEEIATQEGEWTANFSKHSKAKVQFSKEDVEVLLEGGDPAATLLAEKLNPAIARAVLETRQSIYNELNPYFEAANAAMAPLLQQQVQLEQVATEQIFVQRNPEFVDYLPKAREVASALIAQYPNETKQMTREQFVDEVRAQTDRILQAEYLQFHPGATDTYRDAVKAAKAAKAAPAPAAPAAVVPAAPAAPAAPVPPPIKAPGTNAPGAISAGTSSMTPDQKWHRDTAASLVD